jgi:hypothetical protein
MEETLLRIAGGTRPSSYSGCGQILLKQRELRALATAVLELETSPQVEEWNGPPVAKMKSALQLISRGTIPDELLRVRKKALPRRQLMAIAQTALNTRGIAASAPGLYWKPFISSTELTTEQITIS